MGMDLEVEDHREDRGVRTGGRGIEVHRGPVLSSCHDQTTVADQACHTYAAEAVGRHSSVAGVGVHAHEGDVVGGPLSTKRVSRWRFLEECLSGKASLDERTGLMVGASRCLEPFVTVYLVSTLHFVENRQKGE